MLRSTVTLWVAAVVLLVSVASVTALSIEQPATLSSVQVVSQWFPMASPPWVGYQRRGKLLYVTSIILCKVSREVRKGMVPMHLNQAVPIRFEGYVLLTEEGECPLYEKAFAADMLGAEGLVVAQAEPPFNPTGISGYNRLDTVLDMPVEVIVREMFQLLVSAVNGAQMEVIVSMGIPFNTARYV